jgi:23S rRNA (uracil1939-C5)-methyltransferase
MVDLALEGIAHGGEAIGRHAGKTVFVPYAIPGERVRAELVEERERWARARLVAVLEASPDRVEPPCPYFGPGKCGGCQWQHIAYERQAELKQEIVADQLRRLGRLLQPNVADVIALADPEAGGDPVRWLDYGYRNRIDFAVVATGDMMKTALRGANGRALMPVDFCLLGNDRIDQLHAALELTLPDLTGVTIRASMNTDDALVVFDTQGEAQGETGPEIEIDLPAAVALRMEKSVQPIIGQPQLMEEAGGRAYRLSPNSYFPPNTHGAAALVDVVLAYAAIQPGETAIDAYSGVGLFSIPLADAGADADRPAHVIAMESNEAACEDFAANAGERQNVELHEGAVEQILPALLSAGQRADLVVLDPPHTGAGPDVLRLLAQLRPSRLIYVASDPATLARDAVHLTALGFRLVEAQPIDLQPQTFRVDAVALWRL